MANLESLNADRVEQALKYIAQTDIEHAQLSGSVKQLEELLKAVKAREYLKSAGSSDGARKAEAECSASYTKAVKEWSDVLVEFKTIDNLRNREFLIIDLFRTLEASRRKGNL